MITNQKLKSAELAYARFMDVILPGWRTDPNSMDTPKRVAKMYLKELFSGIHEEKPRITVFENVDVYDGMVFQGNIEIKSVCSHHHASIYGVCHAAYLPGPSNRIIGLSKLNRIVEYYSRRPQVQENLTMQIHNALRDIFEDSLGIAIVIEAKHLCVSHRGIRQNSTMKTSKLSGCFIDDNSKSRDEFYRFVSDLKK